MWFHEIRPLSCQIPWFCVTAATLSTSFRGYWQWQRDICHQETLYNSWSNAFDPNEKFEWKVSKRCYYFLEPPQKSGPKIAHFYCMKAYRDWLQIQDPQILTVGSPMESKDVWLSGQLFLSVRGSKRAVLILFFIESFRIKSIRPGNVYSLLT